MKQLFFCLLLLPLLTACMDDDDNATPSECGEPINITDTTDAPIGDGFHLNDHQLTGTCLSLTVTATGCNDDEWTAELRTDGSIAESLPTQSHARMLLNRSIDGGGVICQALATKTFYFDLDPYLAISLPSRLTVEGPDSTLFVVLVE